MTWNTYTPHNISLLMAYFRSSPLRKIVNQLKEFLTYYANNLISNILKDIHMSKRHA